MIRRTLAALFAALTLVLLGACEQAGDTGAPAAAQSITIGSNPAGTHVYAVAAGFAKVLQERAGIRATMRPYTGSSVYLPMLQRGEISFGLNTGIDSHLAFEGLPPYTEPMDRLRAVAVAFPLPIMYMVRADSGLERIEDLRGKRVVIAFRSNVALEQLHTAILATGGLTPEDVEPVVVAGLPDAMRMLTEGRADAVPTGLDTALSIQVHSSIPGGIRYLTMGADEAKLPAGMIGAVPVTVTPGPSSVGLTGPTRVAGVLDFLNSSTHVPEDVVYRVIKTLHENWEQLRREYTQLADQPADAIAPAETHHPYHDGAIRYYREVGLWTEAHERNQARLLAE
ncbi:MAG TPA: TAXI family TRAP transporter solute-binding subunit [Gammaproteobacteria bacterium]